MSHVEVVDGDLLEQPVDAIVNAWNRNFIPWWLLLPQGVSGAIKRRAGLQPFRELSRYGMLRSGDAAITTAGRLPHQAIIHVAGLTMLWTSSEDIVRRCARNALAMAEDRRFQSIAFPLIGAGTGGVKPDRSEAILREEAERSRYPGTVRIVRFRTSLSSRR